MADSNNAPSIESLAEDIPLDLACRAHQGTSHVPEQRGSQERAGYAGTLWADWASLARYATTPEKQATLAAEFTRYRAGYRERYRAMLAAKSRTMSTMVTGGSNFPTARNAKRGAAADKRTGELIEYRKRALAAITKALTPEAQPILAGDSDAVSRLKAEIASLEAMQERMKAANATIRKTKKAGPEAQVAALVALGFSEKHAHAALTADPMGRIGFPSYALTNNGANIRRLQERLVKIEADKGTEASVFEGDLARVEEDPAGNRIRVFFPDRVSDEVCKRLKAAGFRWAPSLNAWSAYRNPRARAAARAEAGVEA